MTLPDRLAQLFPNAKRTTLRRMVATGRVSVNGVVVTKFNAAIGSADKVDVAPQTGGPSPTPVAVRGPKARQKPTVLPPRPELPPATGYEIIHEDEDVLVVHKPAGLLTSTGPREKRLTLLAMVEADERQRHPRARVGLIHRLDRDASGLLMFSKSTAAYDSLKTQFYHHTVERVYHAIVRGTPKPPAGRIETHLVERADGVVYSTRQSGKGQIAVTDYELVRTVRKLSLVKVTLQTGRKHQIRVHMAGRNWSILGDAVYGHGEKTPPETRLMLVATRLGFKHPRTGERLTFEIPIPPEMAVLVPE